jgi:hypothetical protein
MTFTSLSIPTPIGPVAGFARPDSIGSQYLTYCTDLKVFKSVSAFFFNGGNEIASLPRVIQVQPDGAQAYLYYIDDDLVFRDDVIALQVHAWVKEYKKAKQCLVTLEELSSIKWELKKHIYDKVGFTSSPIPDAFSQEDMNLMGMSKCDLESLQMRQLDFKLQSVSCHDFALLRSKEEGYCELLYYGGGNKELRLFEFFKNWGYKTVDSPQAGDLVLYLKDGRPMHTGRYLGNGFVESKLGNESNLCHKHPLSVVPDDFGSQMVFYRKVNRNVKYKTLQQVFMENAHFYFHKLSTQ